MQQHVAPLDEKDLGAEEAEENDEEGPVVGEALENCLVVRIDLATVDQVEDCLLYTSPSPRDATLSRMPSSA